MTRCCDHRCEQGRRCPMRREVYPGPTHCTWVDRIPVVAAVVCLLTYLGSFVWLYAR